MNSRPGTWPSLELYAPGSPRFAVLPFPLYLERRLATLRISHRSSARILQVLTALWSGNQVRSARGRAWCKPSQAALGGMTPHRWGGTTRELTRRQVNRILGELRDKAVVTMVPRGRVATDRGYRLSNLIQPGPWLYRQWALWCGTAATRLRGLGHLALRALPEVLRRILAAAARRLLHEKSLSQLCVPPTERHREGRGGDSPPGPSPPPPPGLIVPPAPPLPAPDPIPPHAPGSPEWATAKRALWNRGRQ